MLETSALILANEERTDFGTCGCYTTPMARAIEKKCVDKGRRTEDTVDKAQPSTSKSNGDVRECIDDEYIPELPSHPAMEIREEAEEGRHLYLDFIRQQIQRNGLTEPAELVPETEEQLTAKAMDWTRAGQELRQLADAFARSRERQHVRQRAEKVQLESLNFEQFFLLLQELFQGEGITRERILVLFFFCADVSIEALKKGFHQTFRVLLDWSLKYIATRVAQWVHNHGGWGKVLQSSLVIAYQVTACCAFVAVAIACAVYVRRNLQR